MLFQRVEALTMGSPQAHSLAKYFGGIMSNELIGKSSSQYSERPEPFTFISVPVQNMKTLEVRCASVSWVACVALTR